MIYYFIRPLVQLMFRAFFKRLYFFNESNIPGKGPRIFAVNHPTAFLDPIIPPAFFPYVTYFMLRGDVFTSRLIVWLLKQIKTIPIFRFRDGFESMRKNQETFDYCYGLLKNEKNILILAEGVSKHEKKLRPVQKGTARMAFGAYDKYGVDDLAIIPVGCNFTNALEPRTYIMVDFGEPIYIKDYLEEYREDPRRAIRLLTEELERRMRKLIVHIDDNKDEPMADQLLDINRHNRRYPLLPFIERKDKNFLQRELRIADAINSMDLEEKELLKEQVQEYRKTLKKNGFQDIGLAQPEAGGVGKGLVLLLGGFLFVPAYLLNFLPAVIAKSLSFKMVKDIKFYLSIRAVMSMFFYFFYWLFILIAALIVAPWWVVGLVVAMPLLGYYAILYLDVFRLWSAARKVKTADAELVSRLQYERSELLAQVAG
jgi:glycerol-3-phosphate O-acyltransferase/dihydroxyacetone phosphate acyltransferase